MKTTPPFYKDDFYLSAYVTVAVFNEIKRGKLDRDFEMYGSGEFFFMAALDTPEAREILSELISDIEAYNEYYKGAYSEASPGTISLCGLQDEHRQIYGNQQEIMWEEERQAFTTAEVFFADDDEYEPDDDSTSGGQNVGNIL